MCRYWLLTVENPISCTRLGLFAEDFWNLHLLTDALSLLQCVMSYASSCHYLRVCTEHLVPAFFVDPINFWLYWLVFIMSGRYENEITNIITAQIPVKPFKSVMEFKNAVYRHDSVVIGHSISSRMAYVKMKLGWHRLSIDKEWKSSSFNVEFRGNYGSHIIRFTKEILNSQPWMTIMYIMNRYWMKHTAVLMWESGLIQEWYGLCWNAESYTKKKELGQTVNKKDAEVVDMNRLLPIFVMYCVLICVSGLLLANEKQLHTTVIGLISKSWKARTIIGQLQKGRMGIRNFDWRIHYLFRAFVN